MRICICHRLSIICTSKLGFLGVLRVVMWQCCILTTKRHIPEWIHVYWATAREHLSTGLTCRRLQEKKVDISKKLRCYISPLSPETPAARIFYKIWFGGISPGRNRIFTISYQPVTGFCFWEGSNFAISHRKAWSPLTRCLHYRSSRDNGFRDLCQNHKWLHACRPIDLYRSRPSDDRFLRYISMGK